METTDQHDRKEHQMDSPEPADIPEVLNSISAADKIKLSMALQKELAKKLLQQYFKDKGFEDLNDKIYGPLLFDLPYRIPEIFKSVEVVPYIEQLDPMTNIVTIGWNLFVLGTNRAFVGSSSHRNLADFNRSVQGHVDNDLNNEMRLTVNEVITFIADILSKHKGSIERLPAGTQIPGFSQFLPPLGKNKPALGPSGSGSWYEKNKPV